MKERAWARAEASDSDRCSRRRTQPAPVPTAARARPCSSSKRRSSTASTASGEGGNTSTASKPMAFAGRPAAGRSSQKTNGPPRASFTRLIVTEERITGILRWIVFLPSPPQGRGEKVVSLADLDDRLEDAG